MTILTTEFKNQATEFMLNISKELILTNFDKNNKIDSSININNDTYSVKINRICFSNTSRPYYEDYHVSFRTIIENQKVSSTFYLEWKNNIMNGELVLANESCKGKSYKPKLKIIKC
jgi:hypothetical protein